MPRDRARSGRSSPQLALFLGLLVVLAIAGLGAWIVLRGHAEPEPAGPTKVAPTPKQDPAADPVEAQPVRVEPKVDDDKFQQGVRSLAHVPVKNGGPRDVVDGPVYPLEGKVLDERDDSPIYYFSVYLIPADEGDPLVAKNTALPSKFRNGEFRLDRQPAGTYQLVVESRECDPVVKKIQVPYEGKLTVRLKHSTTLLGFVRDPNQTPLQGLDVQIVVGELDPQADGSPTLPPIQRLTKTDAMGHYAFYKLPPGSYGVQVMISDDVLTEERTFRVDRGAEVEKSFSLTPFGALRVVVKNVADQPVPQAHATLKRAGSDGRDRIARTAVSDLKGIARLDFVREGSYKLEVRMSGFEPFEQPITVAGNEGYRELPVLLQVAAKTAGH
jgi:hypothetical protein